MNPLNQAAELDGAAVLDGAAELSSAAEAVTLPKVSPGPGEQRERELEGLAARMQQVLDADPNGVVIVEPDWRFSFANRRAKEIVNDWELVGHDIFERFPGNGEDPFNSTYRATMADREPRQFEAFHGAPLELWLKVQVRPAEGGGIVVFFSDVTRRRVAEERERQTAGRLEQVLEAMSDAIASLDREWRFTFLNSNAKRLIDPEDRLLGKNIWEEYPEAQGPLGGMFDRSMKEGISGRTELYYRAPVNGWLDVQSEPTSDGIVVFFRNITEEKVQTEQLRRQHELLGVVQEAARVATWELDLSTGRLEYGAGSSNVLGRPLDELDQLEKLEATMLPGHAERVREQIRAIAVAGEMAVVEFAVEAREGGVLWLESRVLATSRTLLRGCQLTLPNASAVKKS